MIKNIIIAVLFFLSISVQAQVTSTFDTDADGWTLINDGDNDTLDVVQNASDGNPGGYISGDTPTDNYPGYFWYAPAKFLGNLAYTSLGQTLTYSQQQLVTGNNSEFNGNYYEIYSPDIIISNGNTSIYYHTSPKPTLKPNWSTYSVTLDELSAWHTGAYTSSPLATRAEIIAVLQNVTALYIRGNYNLTANTVALDEVSLGKLPAVTAPAVTSFVPLSGEPGSSITINGSNFDVTISNNAVYFGAIEAVITSGSSTKLVVTIPAGAPYDAITVINKTTGRSITSAQSFNPTFPGGGRIIRASFAPKVDITLSINLEGLILGDIDGDGWNDLASASNEGHVIDVYRNLGLGGDITLASFAPKISIPFGYGGSNGTGLQLADLDGDGKLDAVTSVGVQFSTGMFTTFRNISTPGNIVFEAAEYWRGGSDETPIALIVDLDSDGRPELLSGESSQGALGNYVWYCPNLSTPGDIEFGATTGFGRNEVNGFAGVSAADLNNDGKPELMVVNGGLGTGGSGVDFFINNSTPGAISLAPAFQLNTSYLSFADFNLDGKTDLAWKVNASTNNIHILLNSYAGGTLTATDFVTEIILNGDLTTYGGMSIGDLNGDGKPDIASTDNGDVGVFENVYAGGIFDASAFVGAYENQGAGNSTYPTSPVIGDLNGDQKPEIVIGFTNTSPDRITIYENKNIHTPVISLHTVSPLAGPIGSTVTITGNNFSTIPSENRVWFGGVEANVLSATATEIKAEVPAGAGYERVSVVHNELTSFYHLPFNVTFSPGTTFDNTSFLPPIIYPLTGADYDVEVADMDNDGKPEIIAESRIVTGVIRNYGLSYKNIHTSGAINASSFVLDDTTSTSARNLKIMDIDADGKQEILAIEGLYRNTSTASDIGFDTNTNLAVSSFFSWADFNLDGKIDIAGTTNGVASVSVYENRSARPETFATGTFSTTSAAIVIAKTGADGGIVSADFDNDGLPEFVSTNPTTDNMRVWRNTGGYRITTTQFTVVGDVAAGDNPGRVYAGDLDVDGKMDLVLYHGTGTNSTTITVFHNESTIGNITFSSVDFTLPAAATVAHIRDLDGDGKPEIIVTSESSDQFFILKNTSTSGIINVSSFATPFAITINNPRGLTTGDLNLDGKPEIIITSAPNSLLVFENIIPSGPTISIGSQPVSKAVCDGTTTSFTVTASGTTNLTYQWQKFDGTVFNNVSNTGGYSGASTATLSINTTGNFGGGDYRCKISGDLASDKFSATATLTVNPVPVAPTTTGASNCIPAAITLTASGGTNGQYRWYDVATGGTAISGQVNSTYVTPVINNTTAYHVSINNGNCESARTAVLATIQPLAKPTLVSSKTISGGNVDLCTGENFTLTAPAGFTVYDWNNGESTQQITIDQDGSYSVILTDAASCVSPSSDPVNVTVNPFPVAEITVSGTQLIASPGDSYQWYQNGAEILGAVNQSFEYNILEYGIYTLDVTSNGCTSTSDEFVYLITGGERNVGGIKVYPNPITSNMLFIEADEDVMVTWYDVLGRKMNSEFVQLGKRLIQADHLVSGTYILLLDDSKTKRYVRIQKMN